MNSHQRRLSLGLIVALLVLTALFLLLRKDYLTISAYLFSLLAPTAFFASLWLVAGDVKNKYITNAAFPMQIGCYGIANLACCFLAVLLSKTGIWSISIGWFSFIQIIIIAFFSWLVLGMDSGQEAIHSVDENIRMKTLAWKTIYANIVSLKERAPIEYKNELQKVADAVRYSDPMECQALKYTDDAIANNIMHLESMIEAGQTEEFSVLCQAIMNTIKDRNLQKKQFK